MYQLSDKQIDFILDDISARGIGMSACSTTFWIIFVASLSVTSAQMAISSAFINKQFRSFIKANSRK